MVEANASWDQIMLHGGVSRAPENVGEWSAGFFPVPDGGIFVPHCSSPEMRILGPWVRIKDKIVLPTLLFFKLATSFEFCQYDKESKSGKIIT